MNIKRNIKDFVKEIVPVIVGILIALYISNKAKKRRIKPISIKFLLP